MKSHLSWLAAVALSSVAVVDTGCLNKSCSAVPFCRWFDLATFCSDNGTCSVPPGMGISASKLGENSDPFGQGTFNDVWSPSSLTVPLGELGAVVVDKPVLEVVLRAGAPLSLDAITITFDGEVARCLLAQRPNPGDLIVLTCDVPVTARELGFGYVVTGPKGSQGNAAFDLQLFLHEPEGRCTGASELCAL